MVHEAAREWFGAIQKSSCFKLAMRGGVPYKDGTAYFISPDPSNADECYFSFPALVVRDDGTAEEIRPITSEWFSLLKEFKTK